MVTTQVKKETDLTASTEEILQVNGLAVGQRPGQAEPLDLGVVFDGQFQGEGSHRGQRRQRRLF